ncbi:MAG: serine/threonine protein kinase, partial [Actinomycetota bacterium]|nr:serine/threonine protein kinase [Actinomycetota bacterium]
GLQEAAREAASAGSFVAEVVDLVRDHGGDWEVSSAPQDAPVWIYVDPPSSTSAKHGWKLHVSAALVSAEDVLQRAAPVLLDAHVPFKLAASFRVLEALNEGEAGVAQIGKFITAYPRDDEEAVDLAVRLDDATRGLRGPRVMSDRPLRRGSLVHYRFGAFDAPEPGEDDTGADRMAARPVYLAPDGMSDPFIAAGAADEDETGLIAGRYYVSSTVHRSARGAVHTAVDMQDVRDCIIKRAWRDARLDLEGRDARDGLRAEAEILRRLEGRGPFPRVFDIVEHDTDLLLVLEKLPGVPVASVVHRMDERGKHPEPGTVGEWARAIASALARVHDAGLVYRDLNPANVLLTREGKVSLIDFELTRAAGEATEFYAAGTPGFLSPQQAEGQPASPADDVYSLGAMIVFMSSAVRPSGDVAPIERTYGTAGAKLVRVAERCLAADPNHRWSDMRAVEDALQGTTS